MPFDFWGIFTLFSFLLDNFFSDDEAAKEDRKLEQKRRRALQSSLIQELRTQYSEAPEEFVVSWILWLFPVWKWQLVLFLFKDDLGLFSLFWYFQRMVVYFDYWIPIFVLVSLFIFVEDLGTEFWEKRSRYWSINLQEEHGNRKRLQADIEKQKWVNFGRIPQFFAWRNDAALNRQ